MSTSVGIHVEMNGLEEAIIIGSDTQYSTAKKGGEIITRGPKIYRPHKGELRWAYSAVGDCGDAFEWFRRKMLRGVSSGTRQGDYLVETALDRRRSRKFPHFPEVAELNARCKEEHGPDYQGIELILAIRKPEFGLWYVDGEGRMHRPSRHRRLRTVEIGSGAEHTKNYIAAQLRSGKVTSRLGSLQAAGLVRDAIGYAAQKIDGTSGFIYFELFNDKLLELKRRKQKTRNKPKTAAA